jgi:diguanylate cyclase (GGDEF)-like protein/PAS domain S-box-containing protein
VDIRSNLTTAKKTSRKNKASTAPGEQTFRFLFEGHSVIMLLIEPQTGVILDANQAAVDFYGHPRSKLCGMSINDINILPPGQVVEEYQKALDEGRNHFIFTHRLAGGEERTVEESLSPITLQEKQAFLSIIHDVTEHRQAEKSLNVEQYFMDALLDNVPAYIYFKDRKSRFIRINNSHAKSLGLSDAGQVVGKTDFNFFTEEHAKQAYADEQLILETGQLISKEEKETRHNLPDTWVSTTKLPLRDNDNNIIGTLGISVDITERKRAEKKLEERLAVERNLLSALLDNLPDVIYVKDMQGRKIISNIADWQRSGGKTIEDVLGKSDFDTYPPELADRFWADDKSVLDTGASIINQEEPGMDRQGNPRWMLTTKVPLRDLNGQITGLIGIGRDITERKQVEDQLRQLSRAVEFSPVSIMITNKDGKIEYVNPKFSSSTGYSLEEVRGRTPGILKSDKTPPEIYRELWQTISSGKEWRGEILNRKKDGELYWGYASISAITDSTGNITHFVAVYENITARKEAEEKIQLLNAELEQLSHTDSLTGINNRGYLFELAEREFNIAMRYKQPFSVMFFDIDHFKKINDTFGHAMGDQVLQQLIQVVRAEIRSADEIGRYGGDEFVVLLPQTSSQEALSLTERIHTSVSSLRIQTGIGPLTLTISIGIAQMIQNNISNLRHDIAPELIPASSKLSQDTIPLSLPDTVENLFLRADRALYAAKQNGRNCTVISVTDSTGAI